MKKIKARVKALLNHTALWIQLTILMVLITTLVAFWLIYRDYTSTRNLTINNQIETGSKILKLEVENLEQYILELANFCIQPYYDTRFTRIVEQSTPLTDEQLDYAKQQMHYYYYTRSDVRDYELYLIHQNLSIGRTGRQQHIITQEAPSEGLSEALAECEESPLNHSIKASDSGHLRYYHSLFIVKGKVSQAIVRLELDESYTKQLRENHSGHGEIIIFLNERGEIVYSNNPGLLGDDETLSEVLATRELSKNGYETIELAGQRFLAVEAEGKTSGIRLLSLTPLSYIDSQIGELQSSIILSGVSIWLFTILLIYMLLRLLTSPLKLLSAQMHRTGKGDFHARIDAEGSLEIRELSDSFNSMVSQIDQLIKRTYIAELNEKDARMAALEAQLNPHFLYNTLQVISTEALINDQPQIHRMITSLASNLRYTIKGGTLVPLEQEMHYVRDYVFLQKMRIGEALEFGDDIPEEVRDCLIPKISIQTLVENSIIHGKSWDRNSIRIQVSARTDDKILTISVKDNGCGIPQERLDRLLADFDLSKTMEKQSGIGLVNLYHRIRLLYDEPATMEIRTKEDKYTEIVLTLPVTREKEP